MWGQQACPAPWNTIRLLFHHSFRPEVQKLNTRFKREYAQNKKSTLKKIYLNIFKVYIV